MTVAGQRVIYVGSLWDGSTARHRMQALIDNGALVTPVDTHPESVRRREATLMARIRRRLAGPPDLAGANAAILAALGQGRPDVLWIDKGLTIGPETLRRVRAEAPGCAVVGYSPDDMLNPGNQSRQFLDSLPLYDVYFTTKSYGVAELEKLGAPCVRFIGNAYDPATHRPVDLSLQEREALGGAVGFVGQWEAARSASICQLAGAGVPVRVWGEDWDQCRCPAPELRLEGRPLWGEAYARALCAFDINLCFLRKANRDLQTTRSMEIPACGGFMLAERTDEHRALFEEGREAEYFSSDAELIEKALYYIAHPDERRAIAKAGRQRCLDGGYSNQARALQMLQVVAALRKN